MKRIAMTIAGLALGLMATTAATCQTPTPTNPVVAGVVDCAEAGVHEAAIHVIDDVASALATGDWLSAMGDLVKKFTEGAVDCAAAEIADTAGKHASMDELEATKAKRAKAWLASRPVTVSQVIHKHIMTGEIHGLDGPPTLAGICVGCGHDVN